MNYDRITRYANCDILIHKNDIEPLGFDKTKTEYEMIDLALKNGCSIITKNGRNGKWYLKGKEKTIDFLKSKINENIGKYRDGVFVILLE